MRPKLRTLSSNPARKLYSDTETAQDHFARMDRVPSSYGQAVYAYADPSCDICGGIGWLSPNVPVGHPLFGKFQPCSCTAAARARRLQQICGLTDIEQRVTLDQIKYIRPDSGTALMVAAVARFIEMPVGMLIIQGKPGNAKSMSLWSVVNACLSESIEAVYVTYQILLDHIRDAYNGSDSATVRLERFKSVTVLALDEFGHDKVKATEKVLELESALIDWRYRWGLAGKMGTIIAMNDEIENLPGSIQSRLRDGRNTIVVNDDPDVRPYLGD